MRAVTAAEARRDLEGLIERVIADAEPTILISDAGQQVVMLPVEEYDAWQETRYLLMNPANAEHLRRSIAEAQTGEVEERALSDP